VFIFRRNRCSSSPEYAGVSANNQAFLLCSYEHKRKNWLFSDTVKGAKASAAFYSLIETAKANKLEPYHYLRYIFKELPKVKTVEQYEALLPWNVDAKDLNGDSIL